MCSVEVLWKQTSNGRSRRWFRRPLAPLPPAFPAYLTDTEAGIDSARSIIVLSSLELVVFQVEGGGQGPGGTPWVSVIPAR
jgi:hypothetical protein